MNRSLVQLDSGDLVDMGVSHMGVIPGDPWENARTGVQGNNGNGQGDREKEINGSQSNKTPVIAVSQVAVGCDEILELLPSPQKRTDGEDWM
jgi:hypothetical protein